MGLYLSIRNGLYAMIVLGHQHYSPPKLCIMKFLFLLFVISIQLNAASQNSAVDSTPVKTKILKTKLITVNKKVITGYLAAISDSSVKTYPEPVRFNAQIPGTLTTEFSYPNIKSIQVWRKGRVGRGMLWGAISGAVIGAGAGLISGNDTGFLAFSAGEKAAGYGIVLGVTGTLVGAIIGAVSKKKFIIHGKKENLKAMRQSVLEKMNMTISN